MFLLQKRLFNGLIVIHYLKKIKERVDGRFYFLWLISWIVVAFGQPSWSLILSPISSICGYSLFWLTLAKIPEKKLRFFHACFWFMCVQAIQLSWMTATAYHGFYIIFVYLVVLVWFGVQFGCLTVCFPSNLQLSFSDCFVLSGLWTLMEWSRLFVFCGFPFNFSGIALAGFCVSTQLAAFIGILGLSFIVMLINALGFKAFIFPKKSYWLGYLGAITAVYLFGVMHMNYHRFKMKESQINYQVALVQTGLKPEEKIPLAGKLDKFVSPFKQWADILYYLEKEKSKHLDLIVLPEAALPYGASREIYFLEDVKEILHDAWGDKYIDCLTGIKEGKEYVSNSFWAQAIANYYQCEVITGFDDYDRWKQESYNAAFHFFPKKEIPYRYEKCILVPLGEYLPFNVLKPIVAKYGIFDFTTPGLGPKVFGENIPIAISICYEECFGHLIRRGRVLGAQLFVNVTNDGWFAPSKLPYEHFYHARLRTIENGVPLIRSCNTGVTAVIDSIGSIHASLPTMEGSEIFKGALITSFPVYHYSTWYTFYGDNFIIGISFAIVFVFVITKRVKVLRRAQVRS